MTYKNDTISYRRGTSLGDTRFRESLNRIHDEINVVQEHKSTKQFSSGVGIERLPQQIPDAAEPGVIKWGLCKTNWKRYSPDLPNDDDGDAMHCDFVEVDEVTQCEWRGSDSIKTGEGAVVILPTPGYVFFNSVSPPGVSAYFKTNFGWGDPNIEKNDIIAYAQMGNGDYVCVSAYLDDKIGTIKMWATAERTSGGQTEQLVSLPRSWTVIEDFAGRFPKGAQTISIDEDPAIGSLDGSKVMSFGTELKRDPDTGETLTPQQNPHFLKDLDHRHQIKVTQPVDSITGTMQIRRKSDPNVPGGVIFDPPPVSNENIEEGINPCTSDPYTPLEGLGGPTLNNPNFNACLAPWEFGKIVDPPHKIVVFIEREFNGHLVDAGGVIL